jgi:hypothetical protein
MNIDLRISGVPFALGEQLDSRKLALAKCDKAGLVTRLMLKPPSGHLIHFAKNCEISCFGGEFAVWANLDRSRGPDEMSGTSAYLYFKNLILESVKFQVLLNQTMAIGGAARFEKLCKSAFGAPSSGSPVHWQDGDAVVLCSPLPTRDGAAFFLWKTRRHMEEHGLLG